MMRTAYGIGVWVAAIALAATGCDDGRGDVDGGGLDAGSERRDGEPDPGDAGPGGPVDGGPGDAARDDYIDALCTFAVRCEGELGPGFVSRESCVSWYGDAFDCVLDDLFAELGFRVAADPGAVAECVAYLESAACSLDDFAGSPCLLVFSPGAGDGAEGDACESFPPTCSDELYCRTDFGTCSACTRYGALGDDCTERRCVEGTRCDPGTLTCSALLANGADCVRDAECATGVCLADQCDDPQPLGASCEDPDHCSSGRCAGGSCAAPPGVGDGCAADPECGGFRVCVDGRCAERLPAGASCAQGSECLLDHWCIGGQCVAAGSCEEVPLGASCDGFLRRCGADAYCDDERQTCEARQPVGGPCDDGQRCVETARCDFGEGACVARAAIGEACASRLECPDGAVCGSDRTCQLPAANGAACAGAADCESGYCDASTSTCAELPACPPL